MKVFVYRRQHLGCDDLCPILDEAEEIVNSVVSPIINHADKIWFQRECNARDTYGSLAGSL